jgi:hypothetical protein
VAPQSEKAEKPEYVFVSYHQTAGQNHNIKVVNKFFENMTQNIWEQWYQVKICVKEEIKRSLHLWNACYCAVKGLLFSCLLSENCSFACCFVWT